MGVTIGGSVEHAAIAGRLFAATADGDVSIKLGGYSNKEEMNGNRTVRYTKTVEAASVEGLEVEVNHDRADLEFLQEKANSLEPFDFEIKLVSGHIYSGKMQITDMPEFGTQKSTAKLKLAGAELTQQ